MAVHRITPPAVVEAADIRWLDFRVRVGNPVLISPENKALLMLRYLDTTPLRTYYLAESVLAQVDDNNRLAAVWITQIGNDRAGQKIAAFRRKVRGGPEPFS